jgi:hypothetical protein
VTGTWLEDDDDHDVECFFSPVARQPLGGLGRLSFRGFTITLRHKTLVRTPLDEGPETST